MSNELHYCPFCGEEIKSEGRWCPYCGGELPHEEPTFAKATSSRDDIPLMKRLALRKVQKLGSFGTDISTMPPLTYGEAIETGKELKKLADRFYSRSTSNKTYATVKDAAERWLTKITQSETMLKDEDTAACFLILVSFVEGIVGQLYNNSNTSDKDLRYASILSVRVLHIYYATPALNIAKAYAPDIYAIFSPEFGEHIQWEMLKCSFDNEPQQPKPQEPKPQKPKPQEEDKPKPQENKEPRQVEPMPEDKAEVEGLAKELGENCPRIFAAPYIEGHDYWADLNKLIGLKTVKEEMRRHIDSFKVQLARKRDHPDLQLVSSFNCIFKGKPGTGKTTVARLVAGILRQEGIISRGHCIETSDAQLCGQYVGITPKITRYTALMARGGILFIDEAYNLANHKGDKVDFGKEVIDTLTPMLENNRGGQSPVLAILAGYDKEMDEFLGGSNTGFGSRFQYVFHFDDYNAEEMLKIFMGIVKKNYYYLSGDAEKRAKKLFEHIDSQRTSIPTFANARTVRSVFEIVSKKTNARIAKNLDNVDKDEIIGDDFKLTKEELRIACGIL